MFKNTIINCFIYYIILIIVLSIYLGNYWLLCVFYFFIIKSRIIYHVKKFNKIFLILSGLIAFSFYNYCFADNKNDFKDSKLLSGSEIDLLVGTPEGISEPLDSRRNNITKDNQVDYSKFFDDNALSESTESDFEWKDAEESVPNENQVENQLMDLLAETEELEKTDEIYYYEEENETATDSEKI